MKLEQFVKLEVKFMYNYNAKVIKVVDGDTFKLQVDLGFGCTYADKFRILDLDTYETKMYKKYHVTEQHKQKGIMIKDFVTYLLQDKQVTIKTQLIKGYYKRYLCELYFNYEQCIINLRDFLVDVGCDKKFDSKGYTILNEQQKYPKSILQKFEQVRKQHEVDFQ